MTIDTLEARGHAWQIRHRPQIGIEVERLPQPDVDAGEPFADRGRHGPFQRDAVALNRLDQRLGQRRAVLVERE
jgi:hypothetical protein